MFFSKSVLRNVISLKLASDRRVVIQASDSEAEVFLTHSFPGELLVDLSFQGWNLCFLAANAALPQSPFCSQWPHGSKNTQDRAGRWKSWSSHAEQDLLPRSAEAAVLPSNLRLSPSHGLSFPLYLLKFS